MSKKNLALLFIVSVVCLVLLSSTMVFAEGEDFIGKPVPAFTAKDLEGKDHDIASYKGKTVLINFWGLRCGSCIEEMPHLNVLYDKYKDKGFVLLGINADGIDAAYLTGDRGMVNLPLELNYTILQDPDMKLIDLFKMEAAPLNILIDKEGIVQFYHVGYEPGDEKILDEKIKSAIE